MINFEANAIVKSIIREPFAWPGGYERFAITTDGAVLCYKCLKTEYKIIAHSTLFGFNDGWQVCEQSHEGEQDEKVICDHCYRTIVEEF